ncbi:MAG: acetyl-CoA carboxylase, biotin carboxyl carrier protein [Clostridiaceae bacterium]|nr:acetyl-CoA carboxylase, biotin carboxyl carrier protein [Clostridiaceae bacterium]
MGFELIKELIILIDHSKIIDFKINLDGVSIEIKKSEEKSNHINTLKSKENSMIKLNNALKESALYKETSGSYIISPVVGIFYSSRAGRDKPFIKLGDKVKRGDVVCIIEILNVSNEIKSIVDGQVVEILVSNECMVEYGQKLFRIT